MSDAESFNPFAAPEHAAEAAVRPEVDSDVEQLRRACIKREATVKSIGLLCMLAGALGVVGSIWTLSTLVFLDQRTEFTLSSFSKVEIFLSVFTSAGYCLAGFWIRRLEHRGRALYGLLVAFDLVLFLIGLALASGSAVGAGVAVGGILIGWIIPILFLVLLFTGSSHQIFTEHYRTVVIPATRHIKYRTPIYVWVILALVVLAVIAGITYAVRN